MDKEKLIEKWGLALDDSFNNDKKEILCDLLERQEKHLKLQEDEFGPVNLNDIKPDKVFPDDMFKLVRLAYPNTVSGDLFSEFPMRNGKSVTKVFQMGNDLVKQGKYSDNDGINFIKPIYTTKVGKK